MTNMATGGGDMWYHFALLIAWLLTFIWVVLLTILMTQDGHATFTIL